MRLRSGWVAAMVTAMVTGAMPAHGMENRDANASRDVAAVTQEYVGIALESNLALRGQQLEVERAAAALRSARAHFFPEFALQARYTRADGGRAIDFPAGTLLNPAYQTLNDLLVAQGQAPRFSPVPDVNFPFQRAHEQDTRVTLRQPLYQPALPAVLQAQRELVRGSRATQTVLAQQLRRDVTVAYLNWLMALRARDILAATQEVLDENLRVNESLLRNGRITQDQVLRAQTEQLQVQQQSRGARNAIDQARSYVNFLLNRPLDTKLEEATLAALAPGGRSDLLVARDAPLHDGARRAELEQIDAMAAAAEAQQRAARAALWPTLALGVDAGTQGESWQFGPGYNFVAGSLLLSWKFFDGGANRAEAERARLAARQARLRQQALTRQVDLEVQQARDQFTTARDSLTVAVNRGAVANAALRIAARKRDAGSISQVEFLDARSAATAADLSLNLTRFELLQRHAELTYALGN
jgi:outer membrane protein TolC